MRFWTWFRDHPSLGALGVLIALAGLAVAVASFARVLTGIEFPSRSRDAATGVPSSAAASSTSPPATSPPSQPTPASAPAAQVLAIESPGNRAPVDREFYAEGTRPANDRWEIWALVFNGTKLYFGGACAPANAVGDGWRSAKLYAGAPTAADSGKSYEVRAVMVAAADSQALRDACVASRGHGILPGELPARPAATARVLVVRR